MNIYDAFNDFKKTTATPYKYSNVPDPITGETTETKITATDIEGIFYLNSASNYFLASKLRDSKTTTLVLKYGVAIDRNYNLTINGANYSITDVDNVGEQNEIIILQLEEIS